MGLGEDFEEDWVAEAQVHVGSAAEGEFARYKLELKRKAGLLKEPLVTRAKRSICRLKDSLRGLFRHLVHALLRRQ